MTSLDPGHFPPLSTIGDKAVYQIPHQRNSPLHIPAIPDLRFEQSYLRTIAPFLNVHKSVHLELEDSSEGPEASHTGTIVHIDWRKVIWITCRDQVLSPLIQGALWGFASQWLIPSVRHLGSKLGSLLFQPAEDRPSRPLAKDGAAIERLRKWSRNMTNSAETNFVL